MDEQQTMKMDKEFYRKIMGMKPIRIENDRSVITATGLYIPYNSEYAFRIVFRGVIEEPKDPFMGKVFLVQKELFTYKVVLYPQGAWRHVAFEPDKFSDSYFEAKEMYQRLICRTHMFSSNTWMYYPCNTPRRII